jgi:tRNA(Ile)-lysidine synthase
VLNYHHSVREKVLGYVRERGLVRAGDRVCVAVSGGADSVALLRILLALRGELGVVLFVAHFNHLLRADESDADQAFVADLARTHGLEFFTGHADVREHAKRGGQTVEAAARELRYQWLGSLARMNKFDAVATGHTQDDQAETVLMKFLRGTGTRGLAGIYPELPLPGAKAPPHSFQSNGAPEGALLHQRESPEPPHQGDTPGAGAQQSAHLQNRGACLHGSELPGPPTRPGARIVRPLLATTHAEVEAYLVSIGQPWREDESNLDGRFTRNRVRHELLPLLTREYNPNVRKVLSETAEIARAEEDYWQELTERELAARTDWSTRRSLRLDGFPLLPLAVRRRVLKAFLAENECAAEFGHIENVLRCAMGEVDQTSLPGDWLALHHSQCLQLSKIEDLQPCKRATSGYTVHLPIPGGVHIPEIGVTLKAVVLSQSEAELAMPGTLLKADLTAGELIVRNWRPGDRYRPAHRRSEEKLKRLFSEKKIPEHQRAAWPVGLLGERIVWVRGFPVADDYRWTGNGDAVRIEEQD